MRQPKGMPVTAAIGDGSGHHPKRERPHMAQEYRDNGQHELSEEMVKFLRPWAQEAALGIDRSMRKGVHHA